MNLPLGMCLLLSILVLPLLEHYVHYVAFYIMIHFIMMLNVPPVSFQIILSFKVEAAADVPVSHKGGSSCKKLLYLNLCLSEEEKSASHLNLESFSVETFQMYYKIQLL